MSRTRHPSSSLKRSPRQSGQMLVVVAVVMMTLLAIAGLVTDSGLVQCNRRHAQRAADAAAQAGARRLLAGQNQTSVASAISSATFYAEQNMIAANNISVEIPPSTSHHFNGSNNYCRVRVIRPVNTTFMRLFLNLKTVQVAAYATAGIVREPVPATVMALDPATSPGLKVSGNGTLRIFGGSVYVDSAAGVATSIDGGSYIQAPEVNVVGGVDNPQGVIGTLNTGMPVEPDPFATVDWPEIISSSQVELADGRRINTSPNTGGTSTKPANKLVNSDMTLSPGIYWGGLKITGGTVTMLPGIYYIAGGGFEVSGQASLTSNGEEVMIYNASNPYKLTGHGAPASIDLTGGGTLNLIAPSSGPYKGFLLVNDDTNSSVIKMAGQAVVGSEMPIKGYVYNPNGELQISGGAGSAGLGAVCRTIKISGGATLGVLDKNHIPAVPVVRLVE